MCVAHYRRAAVNFTAESLAVFDQRSDATDERAIGERARLRWPRRSAARVRADRLDREVGAEPPTSTPKAVRTH